MYNSGVFSKHFGHPGRFSIRGALIALVVASALLATLASCRRVRPDKDGTEDTLPDMVLTDATYTFGESGRTPVIMYASKITIYSKEEDRTALVGIRFEQLPKNAESSTAPGAEDEPHGKNTSGSNAGNTENNASDSASSQINADAENTETVAKAHPNAPVESELGTTRDKDDRERNAISGSKAGDNESSHPFSDMYGSCNYAVITKNNTVAELRGDIVLHKSSDNFTIRCNDLIWNNEEQTLYTSGIVNVSYEDNTSLRARGFSAKLNENLYEFDTIIEGKYSDGK